MKKVRSKLDGKIYDADYDEENEVAFYLTLEGDLIAFSQSDGGKDGLWEHAVETEDYELVEVPNDG
jgi:hypothetical protein